MQNQNNNQPPSQFVYQQTPTQPEPVSPVPPTPAVPFVPPTPPSSKPNPLDKWKNKFNSLPKNTKMLVLVVAVLFAIIFILLILSLLFGKKQVVAVPTPSPTPVSVSPSPQVILNASKYATDSGVLKIESDLNNFKKQLDSSNVKQSDLNIPNIDFNININK